MLKSSFKKYQQTFKLPVLTSRGVMKVKNGYYLFLSDGKQTGVGECSFIEGLSIDDLSPYENMLQEVCNYCATGDKSQMPDLEHFPSIRFGYETALLDLSQGGKMVLFEGDFTKGAKQIPINGLVWMGKRDFMLRQIGEKLEAGFRCIKIKVGAINFEEEIMLLDFIRSKFPSDLIEIRLDANGSFNQKDVFKKLERLAHFDIHSIEQPVKQGQIKLMQEVCKNSPILIALDEELIGIADSEMKDLLCEINPSYIILKPSLLGGFERCNHWIELAKEQNIGWWATSALESNIGLNAIAQWVFGYNNPLAQGLGTGGLYTKNVASPLFIENGCLGYNPTKVWGKLEL
ncbi:MAG: o-succinylbenzoate synthase [Bacteroidetes bacterium]|nr:o-succinylbenzoate synthase [Bacteroidota bacterium]